MHPAAREPSLNRGDTWSLWLFVAAGGAIATYTVVQGVLRIAELLRNSEVPVPAAFVGTVAKAPIGPDGALVDVELDRAVLTAEQLPAASVGAGVLEALTVVLATAAVVVLLALLCRELTRGRIFSRRNSRLVAATGLTWVGGAALAPFFGNMVANGAFATISNRSFDNVIMAIDAQSLVAGAFLAAFIASVFAVGERVQRDTEGLV